MICNLTISSILQKPNKTPTECTHTLAYVMMKRVKHCTCAFRVCSFTAWFCLLKCIKKDRKIQDMGAENVYIYVSCRFFSSKISTITNVILILYNSSINNKLILRELRFRHHIACFCSISPTKKIIPNSYSTVLRLLATWQRFLPQSTFKWFGSVAWLTY